MRVLAYVHDWIVCTNTRCILLGVDGVKLKRPMVKQLLVGRGLHWSSYGTNLALNRVHDTTGAPTHAVAANHCRLNLNASFCPVVFVFSVGDR